MSSADSPAVGEQITEGPTDSVNNIENNVDMPQERKRKRQRPRRKRKLGKATYLGPRKITASVRAQQVRSEMFAHGQPVAPYNTTQFLIEDHGDLQNIDAQLRNPQGSQRPSRTRDSSFSIDSDEDYFYSSPEDEEEFLTKEFSLEYQDLHVERLNSLSKSEIIHDYLLLEGKYEKCMGELRKLKGEEQGKVTDSGRDTDASSRSDADIHEQLRVAHIENRRLKAELEKLKRENAHLHSIARREVRRDSASSVDSESDSSSTSSITSTNSSTSNCSTRSQSSEMRVSASSDVSQSQAVTEAMETVSEGPSVNVSNLKSGSVSKTVEFSGDTSVCAQVSEAQTLQQTTLDSPPASETTHSNLSTTV